jgi:Deoxyribonuclease NucA/NucB
MAYPELVIDWRVYPRLADNVWQAQLAGWPKVLTYNGPDPALRREQRHAAMHYEHAGERYEIPHILSRDEYPFACTREGGRGWVGHIPAAQNSAQGGLIAGFLKRHAIAPNRGELSKFAVKVINHPRGPVTR